MCDHCNKMKSYKISIMKGGMKYQNHVVSVIKPAIYKTPYIEKNAIKIQQQAEEKRKQLEAELKSITMFMEEKNIWNGF